jgi:hypothetical protein
MNTHTCRIVSPSRWFAVRLLLAASCCLFLATLTHAQTFETVVASRSTWSYTGHYVPPGTLLQLSAVGQVNVGDRLGSYGPEGTTRFADGPGYPAETRTRYGLVARLTASNINPAQNEDGLYEQWAYGDTPGNQYCAASGGYLFFTVNDNHPGDNSGAFTVTVTQATCPSEAVLARIRVNLYTADNRFVRPTRRFRVGDTIVLRVENNTPRAIYLRSARNTTRLIREEGLQIERAEGSGYVSILPSGRSSGPDQVITDIGNGTATSVALDYIALTQLVQLRPTWNITRRWTALAAGSYRLTLVYYDSRDTGRSPHTVTSSTFEVQ